jgi:uncharacterized protein YndB with AHSA1/START domain
MNAVVESPIRLSLTRSFDVAPETLFDAWLQKSWGDWLGPEGVVCLSCELDPRVGGKWQIHSRMPDGSEVQMTGVYREINRSSQLVLTWRGCFSGPDDTLVTVTFKAKGAGTEMTLTHEGFLNEDQHDRHNGGWTASFDRLARHLG